jgi:hypothetical protein
VHVHDTGKHDPNGGQQPHTSRLRLAGLDDPGPLDREEEGSTPSKTVMQTTPRGLPSPPTALETAPPPPAALLSASARRAARAPSDPAHSRHSPIVKQLSIRTLPQ